MLRTYLLPVLAILLSLGSLPWVAPTDAYAQQATGGENFIFVNYIGQEMTLDVDDVTYFVPGTDTMPEGGRLALLLPAGSHKYAAQIPGIDGSAGEFMIAPGQVVAKAARIEQTSPQVEDGILIAAPDDFVLVFDFDPFAEPGEEIPVVDTWQPENATPGSGSLVFNNFVGDELTIDLNGQLYRVAPPEGDIPGRLQIDVSPGLYRYTASVPAGSTNGEIEAVPGQVVGLTIYADPLPEPEYKVGEEFEFLRPLALHSLEEELTARAQAASVQASPDAAPGTLPATGGELEQPEILSPASTAKGLVVKNFAGDTLIFTINNQAYSVPVDQEQTLALPPGRYTFTASIPFVATTGELDLQTGQRVELSIAINVAHDLLSVYQN